MPRSPITPELLRIGSAIRDRRERRDETQIDVAERAGISRDRLGDIEVGHRASRRTYLKLADALDMSVEEMDDLISGEVRVP